MPEPQRYVVTAAVRSSPRKEDSLWAVTFSPKVRSADPPLDPEAERTLVITIPPANVDVLFFNREYTREEIESLRAGY